MNPRWLRLLGLLVLLLAGGAWAGPIPAADAPPGADGGPRRVVREDQRISNP